MKFSYLLIAFLFLVINGCSDFSSEADEFELSGKMYACDESVHGDIANDTKAGKKQYCNGLRWIDLIPEDSTVQNVSNTQIMYVCKNGAVVKFKNLCSEKPSDYLPLDDTEYPYAGIPRIVIETEKHRAIKDRETEIPAKLQIWGESAPESEIMELTIRGRGNSTWKYPKKPYAIKFTRKQPFLGMPKAKKWVMLANYRDRTLIRNALALEIARQIGFEWTPQGKFADIFLNNKFIGNYFICEKIEVSQNRLDLNENSYLLEFDSHYDEVYKFRTNEWNYPVNIKYPKEVSDLQFFKIQDHTNNIEKCLKNSNDCKIDSLIDIRSFADYFLVYELSQNFELNHPKSVYTYKNGDLPLKAGPVWDFDWGTFCQQRKGFINKDNFWYKKLFILKEFQSSLRTEWVLKKNNISSLGHFIDSLAAYIQKSNGYNIELWDIKTDYASTEDEHLDFGEAINMLKINLKNRIEELSVLLSKDK